MQWQNRKGTERKRKLDNHNRAVAATRRAQLQIAAATKRAVGPTSVWQRRELLQLLAAAPLWSSLALAAPTDAPVAAAPPSENGDLTTVARLLAGLPASSNDPALMRILQSPAWHDHQRASAAGAAKLTRRLRAMNQWQALHLDRAAGGTLVYPFSGPDFVNAYALFPQRDAYIFFSLEEPGELPQLAAMNDGDVAKTLEDLRLALNDLVHLNFFITPNMKENVRESSLHGVAPVLLAMMALMNLQIDRVAALDLWPERTATIAALPANKQPELPLRALQIDFHRPEHGRRQKLIYLSLDVSDRQLRYYPEFINWLRGRAAPAVLLKSASYLLHGGGFEQVRNFVLERASVVVQDDTGLPYRMLADGRWKIDLHGRYEQPVDLFKKRYQDDLAAAFAKANGDTVPFPFGYNWRSNGNSFVIVARRERAAT